MHLQGVLCEERQLCHHHEAVQLQPGKQGLTRTRWGGRGQTNPSRAHSRRQLLSARCWAAGQFTSNGTCQRYALLWTEHTCTPALLHWHAVALVTLATPPHPTCWCAGRRLPLPLALKYAIDIVKGLVELHRLGVIAADLKPDNVLIDEELGDAVIADFGISSVVTTTIGNSSGRGSGMRSSGAMRGTPNYM